MLESTIERPPWLLRIRRSASEAPVGAGIFVGERHIVTCAHVVMAQAGPTPLAETVYVEFQYAEPHQSIPARVVEGGWHPDPNNGTGDVAVLELQLPPPQDAMPAPLCSTEVGVWDHRFRAYGYPRGHEETGVPSRGVVIGAAGVERLQLQSDSALGFALERGFSGSPVWDVDLAAVIGMVVTRDRPRGDGGDPRTGYAIPVEVIGRYWPPWPLPINSRPPAVEPSGLGAREREHLNKLVRIHERSIQILEQQEARYAGSAPVHLLTQLEDERCRLSELRRRLGPEK